MKNPIRSFAGRRVFYFIFYFIFYLYGEFKIQASFNEN